MFTTQMAEPLWQLYVATEHLQIVFIIEWLNSVLPNEDL